MAAPSKDQLNLNTVLEKTGKPLDEWYRILDEFDCKTRGHTATANYLHETHGVSHWWSQTLTVDYERAKGIREVGQRSGGKFAVNVSKTIAVPVERAWQAWADAKELSTWFTNNHEQDFTVGGAYRNGDGDKGTFKKIVPSQRIHFTWDNEKHSPGSLVIVEFLAKGENKTTVAITQEKLPDRQAVEEQKEGWNWALSSLKNYLETGAPIGFEDWKAKQT